MKAPVQESSVVSVEITPRSIVLILAAVAGVWLAYQLWIVVLILVMALVLAGTFNPVIEWMEARGIKRTYALLLLFVALVVAAVLLVFLTLPPLIDQLTQMVHDAPATRRRLIVLLNDHSVTKPLSHLMQNVGTPQSFARLEAFLLGYSTRVIKIVGLGATTLVLSFYLLADGKRTQGVLYAIVPRNYHMRLARIIQNMETIVGGYMRGQFITSAALGLFTFVLLVLFKVPNAMSLALFGALVDVIPFIGGFLVIIPAVLSALPLGVAIAGTLFLCQLTYMEFESRILVPRIYGQVLRLSPTVVILALLAGGTLMGLIGALLALPIAAGLFMMLEELKVDLPGNDSVDLPLEARHAKQEARYEMMSAGAAAPEAGEIAKNLAHDSRAAEMEALKKAADEAAG
ncbi:MAG: AI-2E family transporter [Gemmatimonadaceae bacterium]|nr:AI-2E family transporter [Gemmatimonadaceae bacterium]